MPKNKKPEVTGLQALGARLRELRIKAGISQMKLAEALGLNPTHGYKYILRLEKGLVPNPTLRTITTFLAACGANWKDIADVLPDLGLQSEPREKESITSEPLIVAPPAEPQPSASIAGGYPAAGKTQELFTEGYWKVVRGVLNQVWAHLHTTHLTPANRRAYFHLVRSICATLVAYRSDERTALAVVERTLERARKQGLDPALLERIKDLALKAFSNPAVH